MKLLDPTKQGFSLVELSIVLVILGLLVGGVLSGQGLIKAAELRKITTAISETAMVHAAFRDKYFHLPGDMPNATAFWGQLASCPADPSNGSTATCNGNGDGLIDNNSTDGNDNHEPTRAWQQLANAGLIKGKYSGRYLGGNNLRTAGMGGEIDSNFFVLKGTSGVHVEAQSASGNANGFGYPLANYIFVGSIGSSGFLDHAITSVVDTWNIDTKIDDGKSRSGVMFVNQKFYWYDNVGLPSCTNSTDTDYNISLGDAVTTSNRGPGCQFIIKQL